MTKNPAPQVAQAADGAALRALFDHLHRASRDHAAPTYAQRRDRLLRLQNLVQQHDAQLKAAVAADFGVRGPNLTEVADMMVLRASLADNLRHLKRWMEPKRPSTPVYLRPASGHVQRQPVGVVGIISPWNYPVQLALAPTAAALAAGNRVILKPSELTPHTSQCLADLIGAVFAPDELAVVQGDATVAAALAALPLDHLFFTGSTAVGRKVAQAAAVNLTPTTLELGGKSPAIVDITADLADAALKIAHGKLLNAGQTCIAPDYVLVPQGREQVFGEAYAAAVAQMFPTIEGNPDYCALITERHAQRLRDLLADAQAKGARIVPVGPSAAAPASAATAPKRRAKAAPAASRQMQPVLVFEVRPEMALMQEEIFGPVLPVVGYGNRTEVTTFINARPRPLALYWFGRDAAEQRRVMESTTSGGVTINDTLMHIAHEGLPFGGVGDSGLGGYHGEAGFLRFTHEKSVLVQSPLSLGHLFYPPYGRRFESVIKLVRRLL